MGFKVGVPVWCEYTNGFREPEGDVVTSRYPKVGEGMVLCDGKVWMVVALEGPHPSRGWPKVICCRANDMFKTFGRDIHDA